MDRAHADWLGSRFDRMEQALRLVNASEPEPRAAVSLTDEKNLEEAISQFETQLSLLKQVETELAELHAQYSQKLNDVHSQFQNPAIQSIRNDLIKRLSEIDRSTNNKVRDLKRSFIDNL
jgi:DNA anti-recombination protein RmuC